MNNMDTEIFKLAMQVGDALKARSLTLATAESCTGGWIAKAITDVPGSSQWFDRGFVTYTNQAKIDQLSVSDSVLLDKGAVSQEVVSLMVAGALKNSGADIAVAISGIAGPDGGSPDKPVGMVWVAWSYSEQGYPEHDEVVTQHHLSGDRQAIRGLSVKIALQGILEFI